MDIPVHNPWFWIFIVWKVFSAIVSGMPEPDENSSNRYIWAYRSCHIIADSGTAYFSHKNMWKGISGEKCEPVGK